ncbi:Hsp20/alpha crystallin family protein [Microbacterium sp. F51-2R]|uniref:Hsp20/alpha crystallin family protein n=1 Tax=Microbacterium sp. F51-2R TaxID=3445777 RepID=UPI003FA06746
MALNLVRFDPFLGLETLRRDLFGEGLLGGVRVKMPTTDVYTEDDKQLVVEAHLPNFEEKDITVNIDRGALVIQAERHEKDMDKAKQYVVRESSSSLYRSIALPEQADDAKTTAVFENGVLKVTVPLLPESASPRQIQIGSTA